MDFRSIPKVELHLHLDCSLSYEVVSRLAPEVSLDQYRDRFIAPPKCTSLADFLERADNGFKLMQSERELRLVTNDLFEQLRHDHVIYAEIRFAPLLHTEHGLKPDEVVEIVDDATANAIKRTGVQARLILCTLRHYNQAQSLATAGLAWRFHGTRVAGFDMAADEAGFPIEPHIPAFRFAAEKNIPCTSHAGEARGPESVWETLRELRARRIGHGVRSIEDPALIRYLHSEGIHLEICPTCNIQTDVFAEYKDHPISRLFDLGLSIGVNTDARAMSNITLSGEYQKLHDTFGWTTEHFFKCNSNALRASFITDNEKKELLARLAEEYAERA